MPRTEPKTDNTFEDLIARAHAVKHLSEARRITYDHTRFEGISRTAETAWKKLSMALRGFRRFHSASPCCEALSEARRASLRNSMIKANAVKSENAAGPCAASSRLPLRPYAAANSHNFSICLDIFTKKTQLTHCSYHTKVLKWYKIKVTKINN